MRVEELIQRTHDYVRHRFLRESSGHDWFHIQRVWKTSIYLCECESADSAVIQLAALLHDLADWKFHSGNLDAGPCAARKWLEENGADSILIDHVCEIVGGLSFKGAGVASPMRTLEGQIVQDADRLDAMGAIGIARAFAYGGHRGRLLYDPNVPPERHDSFEAYQRSASPTLNHFYEKLLLLKDRMNTSAARAIAERRHRYMESFIKRFLDEWDGKDWSQEF
jgi:uncharacterized protein